MNSSRDMLLRKVYKKSEFDNADRITKIRMHLIDPDNVILDARDDLYLSRLNATFNVMSEQYRQSVVVAKLRVLFSPMKISEVYKLMRDAQELYANITERNTYFDKIMQRERILKHLEFCEATNKMKEVFSFEKLLSELDRDIASMQKVVVATYRELPPLRLSVDPSLLHQSMEDKSEEE